MKRLNLLPKPKQQELRYEHLFHAVSVALVLSTAMILLGVIAQLGVWAYLDRTQAARMRDIETLKQQIDKTEHSQQKEEIKLVNNQMTDFITLSTLTPQWSQVLEAVTKHVPNSVKISSITAVASTGKIDIVGYSPTRESVIELYNNINADKDHFKEIDYPLENVSKPTDVQFNFTFFINDEVLTPKP